MLKQQKQEHYRNNLQALLKKLKEEEKLLSKVLNTLNVVFERVLELFCTVVIQWRVLRAVFI